MRSFWFLLLFASLSHLQAAGPAASPVPLAPGPLLNFAPSFAQWLVSTTSGTAAAVIPDAQTKYAERTLVRKTGPIRYEVTVYDDGRKVEKWCEGADQATIIPGIKNPELSNGAGMAKGNIQFTDYSKADFAGFEWISKGNYVGVQTMEGIPCIVFHVDTTDDGDTATPSTAGTAAGSATPSGRSAWIDAEKRLPVLLQDDNVITFYQMEPAPTTQLVLPPDVQAAFNVSRAYRAQATAPNPAP